MINVSIINCFSSPSPLYYKALCVSIQNPPSPLIPQGPIFHANILTPRLLWKTPPLIDYSVFLSTRCLLAKLSHYNHPFPAMLLTLFVSLDVAYIIYFNNHPRGLLLIARSLKILIVLLTWKSEFFTYPEYPLHSKMLCGSPCCTLAASFD